MIYDMFNEIVKLSWKTGELTHTTHIHTNNKHIKKVLSRNQKTIEEFVFAVAIFEWTLIWMGILFF